MTTSLDRLLPTLVHIQTHLDEDLRLETLAGIAGLTPSHLSRTFGAVVGEPPRRYVERLRLERAAVLLTVRDATVLEIALDAGYQGHETFTRAFRRRFGMTPSRWRRTVGPRATPSDPPPADPPPADPPPADPRLSASPSPDGARPAHPPSVAERLGEGSLSATRIRTLRSLPVLFHRHVGPYDAVPADGWDRVRAAARRRGIATGDVLLGVAHDAPGVTAPERCRFDACIVADEAALADWRPLDGVGAQVLPGGPFAITTYVGPFRDLAAAYGRIVERIFGLGPRVELVGLPSIETYRSTVINPDASLNETEIALPVRFAGSAEPPMEDPA